MGDLSKKYLENLLFLEKALLSLENLRFGFLLSRYGQVNGTIFSNCLHSKMGYFPVSGLECLF
jgi:hypothetical protein